MAEYYAPHLAHATMEPPAATARMNGGKWEVWAPLQSPGGARDDIAKALGVKPEQTVVHETLLGGGFGRKSKCDYAIEAALVSKAMDGAPVKVVWTREDDIRHDFYHTVTVDRFEAGLDKSNKVVAWRHRSAAPTFMSNFMPDPKHPSGDRARHGLGRRAVQHPEHPHGKRRGALRSPHRLVPFGQQRDARLVAPSRSSPSSPHELGRDQKDFLLEMIGPARIVDPRKEVTTKFWDYGEPFETFPIDTGRLRNVTELVAKRAGWGRKLPKGHGLGIAAHRSLRHLRRDRGGGRGGREGELHDPARGYRDRLRLLRQSRAGRIRRSQGAAVMGLALAKYGEITFKNGRVQQSNFNDFQITRIDEAPLEVRTHIVEHALSMCTRAASASRACRPSHRRCATPSSRRPESASGSCRSAISSRPDAAQSRRHLHGLAGILAAQLRPPRRNSGAVSIMTAFWTQAWLRRRQRQNRG